MDCWIRYGTVVQLYITAWIIFLSILYVIRTSIATIREDMTYLGLPWCLIWKELISVTSCMWHIYKERWLFGCPQEKLDFFPHGWKSHKVWQTRKLAIFQSRDRSSIGLSTRQLDIMLHYISVLSRFLRMSPWAKTWSVESRIKTRNKA